MSQTPPKRDERYKETEQLADRFSQNATRDILKPDLGLSVSELLAKKPTLSER